MEKKRTKNELVVPPKERKKIKKTEIKEVEKPRELFNFLYQHISHGTRDSTLMTIKTGNNIIAEQLIFSSLDELEADIILVSGIDRDLNITHDSTLRGVKITRSTTGEDVTNQPLQTRFSFTITCEGKIEGTIPEDLAKIFKFKKTPGTNSYYLKDEKLRTFLPFFIIGTNKKD